MIHRSQLATAVLEQVRACEGWEYQAESHLAESLKAYFMRKRGDEVEGRSQVVSGDISAMVESTTAEMMRAFTHDELAEFLPVGADDKEQAHLESVATTHFVMHENNGYWEFQEAIKDGLLSRNAIVKVDSEDSTRVELEDWNTTEPELVVALSERRGVDCEVISVNRAAGTMRTRCTYRERRLLIEALPRENLLVTQGWHSIDLQDCPCVAERHWDSRSELKAMFPKARVALDGVQPQSMPPRQGDARNPSFQSTPHDAADPAQDMIEWYEVYILLDQDGDGISERWKISVVDENTLLGDEQVPLVKYAAGTALINPHRFTGVDIFDKLAQNWDINTALKRSMLDNANATNKSRIAYLAEHCDPDDIEAGDVDGAIAVDGGVTDARAAVAALTVPDTSAGILRQIEYFGNVERAELGGASLQMATGQMQLQSDRIGSEGIDRIYSVMESLANLMTKNMAMSLIRQTYLLAHATLRQRFNQPVPVEVGGQWVAPTPSHWRPRSRIKVKPGMSAGERARKARALGTVINTQNQLLAMGKEGELVSYSGIYRSITDWCRVNELDQGGEFYFIDPASDPAQARTAQKEQERAAADQARREVTQVALGLEHLRVALEKRAADLERLYKYWAKKIDAEVAEAKISGDGVIKLLEDDDARAELESTRGELDRLEGILGRLESMSGGTETEAA